MTFQHTQETAQKVLKEKQVLLDETNAANPKDLDKIKAAKEAVVSAQAELDNANKVEAERVAAVAAAANRASQPTSHPAHPAYEQKVANPGVVNPGYPVEGIANPDGTYPGNPGNSGTSYPGDKKS